MQTETIVDRQSEAETSEDVVDTLIAISVVSKILAKKLRQRLEEKTNEQNE